MNQAFKLGKIGGLTDIQALKLMKHRRVGLVAVIAIHTPRADNANWQVAFFHGANLHATGVGA